MIGWQRELLTDVISSTLPLLILEGLALSAGVPFVWLDLLTRWLFVAILLLLADFGKPYLLGDSNWVLPWRGAILIMMGGIAWLAYSISGATSAAWAALVALYVFLLWLGEVMTRSRSELQHWGICGMLALFGGTILVLVAQIESQFADEEFFVALQAISLAGFGWVLLIVRSFFRRLGPVKMRRGLSFNPRWLGIALTLFGVAGILLSVQAYQHSFYPSQAPKHNGITAEIPFLCGQAAQSTETFNGSDVFRQLLARIEANPQKGAPEYGMLALSSGEQSWAEAFRTSILNEAGRQLFTGPANSVKSVQYEAALRAYYFSKVHRAFPALFTADQATFLRQWFASINRRALTVEWVDWMYAFAFAKWPEGLYENQENGAGLLAVLESSGLAAADLSPANRKYLEHNQRGWQTRFRNTDDAFIYQPEWINNAFFQSLFTNPPAQNNLRLSFEWLLLQALPDGSSPIYNHPGKASLAGIAYLGARLLGDERFIWLSAKALANDASRGRNLFAQPGVEQEIDLLGRSPDQGSCLIYGDSGLPNQPGPLAPDKIVFRDGWSNDDRYLLMNLRFTGWHRYKATNSIILLYQDGPLASEEVEGKPFAWLPVGRSLFRDKRIPRENMNGLLIGRKGMGQVIYELTGTGDPWAQDPPYYARVEQFETGIDKDTSVTVLENWHGWQHTRTVFFFHGGPIVIVDDVQGTAEDQAALIWHLAEPMHRQDEHIRLRAGDKPVEMILFPVGADHARVRSEPDGDSESQVMYTAGQGGRFGLVTVFLTNDWVDAAAQITKDSGQPTLLIEYGDRRVVVPLPFGQD